MDQLDLSTPPKISNLQELTRYLAKLQHRIQDLEMENKSLRNSLEALDTKSNDIIEVLRRRLPNSMLFSDSFFLRALAVWGHFTAIQMIVSFFFFLLAIALGMMGIFNQLALPPH